MTDRFKHLMLIEKQKRDLLKWGRFFKYTLVRKLGMHLPGLSYLTRMHLDLLPYPQYAYGIYAACFQAKLLNYKKISAIEFGVASGNGLVAMEKHALEMSKIFEMEVEVVGFDIGSGMPASSNYKDIPFWFAPGYFVVDTKAVESRLSKAKYYVGDVAETVESYLNETQTPLGFVSFDLDNYTGTVAAFSVLKTVHRKRIPRIICYFDDIFGVSDLTVMCKEIGEERAISEFNDQVRPSAALSQISGLDTKRPISKPWNRQMYAFHDFDHPAYNTDINVTPRAATNTA